MCTCTRTGRRHLCMVSNVLVTDPAVWQPGVDLSRRSWSLLNRFRAVQGRSLANLHKWDIAATDLCACGQEESMNHIVDCVLWQSSKAVYKLRTTLASGDDAVYWPENITTKLQNEWLALLRLPKYVFAGWCIIKATPTLVGEAFIFYIRTFFATHRYSCETT